MLISYELVLAFCPAVSGLDPSQLSNALTCYFTLYLAMAQNYQPPKWMVFLLNMIISVGNLVP